MKNFSILNLIFFFVAISLISVPAWAKIEGNAYSEIYKKFSENHEWKNICPVCQTFFPQAIKEVDVGSEEWQKLIYIKASCLGEWKKDDEAILLLQEALKIVPENFRFLYTLGCSHLRMNDLDSAEKYLALSNRIEKNSDAMYKLAVIHTLKAIEQVPSASQRELLDQAESEIWAAIQKSSDDSASPAEIPDALITRPNLPSLDLLSNIYQGKGATQKAILLRRRLLSATETKVEWDSKREKSIMIAEQKQAIGQLLYVTGQKDEGLKLMEEAVAIAPSDELKAHFEFILRSTTGAISKDELEHSGIVTGTITPLE